jgi:hypothetical protein
MDDLERGYRLFRNQPRRITMKRLGLRAAMGIGIIITTGLLTVEQGHAAKKRIPTCDAATLEGLYIFTASGFNISATGAAQPTAIVESIRFNGEGLLTVPSATVSLNGTILGHGAPGSDGTYTVNSLDTSDGACLGTLTFASGFPLNFDLFIPRGEQTIQMIRTDPNTVFQGTATKVSE